VPLKVITCCYYFTSVGEEVEWTDDDYNANKFVKALKGKPIKGHAYVPVEGQKLCLNQENAGDALGWFAAMIASAVPRNKDAKRLGFVPVPSSTSTTTKANCARTTTHRMARALADKYEKAQGVDLLRWKKAMIPASQGGPRDPEELFPNLELVGKVDNGVRYILVDDVLTSGGHLQACAAKLRQAGATVRLAVCAGRSTKTQRVPVFEVVTEEILDWAPDG
jgi:hypothetical protein